MWVKKQQLEPDMEQWTGSKLGKEYNKVIYCHLVYLTSVMANLNSILKGRDITLPTKACLVKAMVFPVVIYGCEIWTIKKAEHRRIDAFELSCWRRLLRVPWTARRSNQSILMVLGVLGRTDAKTETPVLWPVEIIYFVASILTLLRSFGFLWKMDI